MKMADNSEVAGTSYDDAAWRDTTPKQRQLSTLIEHGQNGVD